MMTVWTSRSTRTVTCDCGSANVGPAQRHLHPLLDARPRRRRARLGRRLAGSIAQALGSQRDRAPAPAGLAQTRHNQKPRLSRAFSVRPRGFEPPRPIRVTRPSTLRHECALCPMRPFAALLSTSADEMDVFGVVDVVKQEQPASVALRSAHVPGLTVGQRSYRNPATCGSRGFSPLEGFCVRDSGRDAR
jgi:hypothetical protein